MKVVTCTATEGTAGITFGAKLEKIDNGYVPLDILQLLPQSKLLDVAYKIH